MLELDTPARPRAGAPASGRRRRGALVLGHGAGSGVGAPDLVLATEVANGLGIAVALVEQPYRVAGRRSTPAPHLLDQAWVPVVDQLRAGPSTSWPLQDRNAMTSRLDDDAAVVAAACQRSVDPGTPLGDEYRYAHVSLCVLAAASSSRATITLCCPPPPRAKPGSGE